MNILFVEGGTRYTRDSNQNLYAKSNICESILKKYKKFCDELTVLGRIDGKTYLDEDFTKYNKLSNDYNFVLVNDIYGSKFDYFNYNKRKQIKKVIYENIKKHDFIIIRSVINYYTITAARICRKLGKKYLIEVTGFGFETQWYRQGIDGKILAFYTEINKKKEVKNAPYVIYVTNKTLQKRYPSKGISLGCSDVEIDNDIEKNLNKRLQRINNLKTLTIGTIGNLNTKLKGQKYVVIAIKNLLDKGIDVKYKMVGRGENKEIAKYIKKYSLEKNILFEGTIPHEKIYEWLDKIDIYIQPSYSEGLSRAIIEAMSRGCLVIATNVGGNTELCKEKYLCHKKSYKEIENIIENVNKSDLSTEATSNIQIAKEYSENALTKKRENYMNKILFGEK